MKKGNLFGSDMLWFMVFILIATLTYLFLFRDLNTKADSRVSVENLETDADFIAESMLRMKVTTKEADYNGKQYTDVIRDVIREYRASEDDFDDTPAFKAYAEFTSATLSNPAMKRAVKDNYNQDAERRRSINYIVLLQVGDEPISATCIQENTGAPDQDLHESMKKIGPTSAEDRRADAALALTESSCNSDYYLLRSEDFRNVAEIYIPSEEPITFILKQTVRVRP